MCEDFDFEDRHIFVNQKPDKIPIAKAILIIFVLISIFLICR